MNGARETRQQRARRRHLILVRRLRIPLQPLVWLHLGIFRIARALGCEAWVHRRLHRPMRKSFRRRMRKAFSTYTPDGRDVLVCSYFKSGTNWTLQTAYQVAHRGRGDFTHIHDVIPWPDAPMDFLAVPLEYPRDEPAPDPCLRIVKTHCPASMVPYNGQARYICVVRDPRDVFVSSYHFLRSTALGELMPPVGIWLDLFLSEDILVGQWSEFVHGYWQWRHRPNVLFLRYEEMLTSPDATIQRIAALLEVELNPAELQRIRHFTSFEYMHSVDHKFYPGPLSPFSLPGGKMMRRGRSGGSDELLDPAQQQRIDDYCRDQLKALGSDFPYHEFYPRERRPGYR